MLPSEKGAWKISMISSSRKKREGFRKMKATVLKPNQKLILILNEQTKNMLEEQSFLQSFRKLPTISRI